MRLPAIAVLGLLASPLSAQACLHCQSAQPAAVYHAPMMVSAVAGCYGAMAGALPMITMPLPAAATAPPPGTLGQTYTRASHPVPEDEHPRTAMVAVRDHRAVTYLRVQRMGGFRMKNGIWLFKSEQPLFPGQGHIVRVEARKNKNDIQPYKTKFVRLIPGRIVYLDF